MLDYLAQFLSFAPVSVSPIYGCSLAHAPFSGACFEWWLYRYQTLLAGIAAVIVAIGQLRIMANQAQISERQRKMIETQERQRIARHAGLIDRYSVGIHRVMGLIISQGTHRDQYPQGNTIARFTWDPRMLEYTSEIDTDFDIQEIAEAAQDAFPDEAGAITEMFKAAKECKALAKIFSVAPWYRERDTELCANSDDALNRLFKFSNLSARSQPHVRAQYYPQLISE